MIITFYFLAGLLAGGLITFCLLRNDKKYKAIQDKLAAKTAQLDQYEQEVTEHFSKTTELLCDLQLQQDKVVAHLADGAKRLRYGMLDPVSELAIKGKIHHAPNDYSDVLSPIKWPDDQSA